MKTRIFLALMISGVVLSMTACINLDTGRSPTTQFYMLETGTAGSVAEAASSLPAGFTIGVGPIRTPQYLNLPMIVTRTGPNEIQSAEFHQWAEPLRDNISRVMSEELLLLTGAAHAFSFPWRSAISVNVQVAVNVIQFDTVANGAAVLKAQWTLFGEKGKKALMTQRSTITRPEKGSGYAGRVATMSLALGDLTREIADAIRKVN